MTRSATPTLTTAGTNLEQAKSHNRRVVIEAVRINGTLSRAEIARMTALSAQTVSNIVGRAGEMPASSRRPRGARPAAASRPRPSPSIPTAPIPSACSSIIGAAGRCWPISPAASAPRRRCRRSPAPAAALPAMQRHGRQADQIGAHRPAPIACSASALPCPALSASRASPPLGPTALPGWQDFPLAESCTAPHRPCR